MGFGVDSFASGIRDSVQKAEIQGGLADGLSKTSTGFVGQEG